MTTLIHRIRKILLEMRQKPGERKKKKKPTRTYHIVRLVDAEQEDKLGEEERRH